MKRSEWISIGGIAVTLFVSIIGSTVYLSFRIGGVFENINSLDSRIIGLENKFDKIEAVVHNVELDVKEIKVKVDILWGEHLEKNKIKTNTSNIDQHALDKTKVGMFVNEHYPEILAEVKRIEPGNARQAEAVLISVVKYFGKDHEEGIKMRTSAIEYGYDIDSLFRMASLSIRDRVIADLSLN